MQILGQLLNRATGWILAIGWQGSVVGLSFVAGTLVGLPFPVTYTTVIGDSAAQMLCESSLFIDSMLYRMNTDPSTRRFKASSL